jgi:hypothetical protein
MFNALVMGISGSVTVRIGRELLGNDTWRLQRTGTLFALCGLFILFGAILIRDCFTTFLNTAVLWVLVRWLVHPKVQNLLIAIIVTGISAYTMSFLRDQAVLLFGLYGFLAFLFWILAKQMTVARMILVLCFISSIIAASPYLIAYTESIQNKQEKGLESYAEIATDQNTKSSLGMRLVINQPLPIRLLFGSGNTMIAPIPLWSYFNLRSLDYHWIKGYNGFYQVVIMPLLFSGLFAVFRMFQKKHKLAIPFLFISAYLLINVLAVVTTSMEQRHIAQFMPAFIILAALPDTREKKTQKQLRPIMAVWFSVVILVHAAWAIMKRTI